MKPVALVLAFGLTWVAHGAGQAAPQPIPPHLVKAGELKAAAKTFRLHLQYHGEQDKPYYSLTLKVPAGGQSSPLHPLVRISEEQARKIIDWADAEGFFGTAVDSTAVPPPPIGPRYTLSFLAEGLAFDKDLGWAMPMLRRLDGLRHVLEGDAAKQMDLLLARLAGHRKQWQRAATADPADRPADARESDRADLQAASLQVALREVEYRMAQVRLRQTLLRIEELEDAIAQELVPLTALEMARLELDFAELSVRAAEIKWAQARLAWERVAGTEKAAGTRPLAADPRAVQHTLIADPIAAIRSVLPEGWAVLKVVVDTHPPCRPEGKGTAVFLASVQHGGPKQPEDAVVYIMPPDYQDGGELLAPARAQTYPARLIAATPAAKVYLSVNRGAFPVAAWPMLREDILRALVR